MRPFTLRLLIALLTFTLGLAAVDFWIIRPLHQAERLEFPNSLSRQPAQRESTISTGPQVEQPAQPQPQPDVPKKSISDLSDSVDRLAYGGYEVIRVFNPETYIATITVRKGRKILATHRAEVLEKDGARIGISPLLGKKTKQLIVAQFSGGAHCCYSFWIYDLAPEFHLLFDSEKYPVSDYMEEAQFLDVNQDGVIEFEAPSNSFAYFHGMFAGSVMPEVIFKYNDKAKKYYPANRLFQARALAGTKEEMEKLRELNREVAAGEVPGLEYIYYMLDVVLRYTYAGKESEAWSFYDKEYKFDRYEDKDSLRVRIKRVLRKDSVYRFIYRRRLHTHGEFI